VSPVRLTNSPFANVINEEASREHPPGSSASAPRITPDQSSPIHSQFNSANKCFRYRRCPRYVAFPSARRGVSSFTNDKSACRASKQPLSKANVADPPSLLQPFPVRSFSFARSQRRKNDRAISTNLEIRGDSRVSSLQLRPCRLAAIVLSISLWSRYLRRQCDSQQSIADKS
jgi:hypothetical protein